MVSHWITVLHLLGISVIICKAQINSNSHEASSSNSSSRTNINTSQSVEQDFFELVAAQTEDVFDKNQELDCSPKTSSQVKDCLKNVIFNHELPPMQICPQYQDLHDCHNLGFQRCVSSGNVLGIDEIQSLFLRVFNENVERNGCDRVQDGRLPLISGTTQTNPSNATHNEGWTQTTTTVGKLSCSNTTPKITSCPESITEIMRERCEFNRDPPSVCYKRGREKCVSVGQDFEKAAMWHSCRAN